MPGPTQQQQKTLYDYIAAQRFGVVATVSSERTPEAALVGIAVSPDLELIFETTDATRKFANLRLAPHIAFVIGGDDQQTLQYEGIADEPMGEERERLKEIFFKAWPELRNHQDWPGLTYFRVKPRWMRFSSYYRPRKVEELIFEIDVPEPPAGFMEKLRALLGAR